MPIVATTGSTTGSGTGVMLANASMKPIYVKNARVLGVLVGVVRKT